VISALSLAKFLIKEHLSIEETIPLIEIAPPLTAELLKNNVSRSLNSFYESK
jgi:hypothetical protein